MSSCGGDDVVQHLLLPGLAMLLLWQRVGGSPAARHDATEFLLRTMMATRRRGGDEVAAEREAQVEVQARGGLCPRAGLGGLGLGRATAARRPRLGEARRLDVRVQTSQDGTGVGACACAGCGMRARFPGNPRSRRDSDGNARRGLAWPRRVGGSGGHEQRLGLMGTRGLGTVVVCAGAFTAWRGWPCPARSGGTRARVARRAARHGVHRVESSMAGATPKSTAFGA